jgi:hypothetical protein
MPGRVGAVVVALGVLALAAAALATLAIPREEEPDARDVAGPIEAAGLAGFALLALALLVVAVWRSIC